MAVVNEAYRTAKAAGASPKVMLALFEAGYVESGWRNLDHGDRDSLGFLQQRASWGSAAERMNPAAATRKFVAKAKPLESRSLTAGSLAQAVQVSAFPGKYDLMAGMASSLLAKAEKANPGGGLAADLAHNNPWIPDWIELPYDAANGAVGGAVGVVDVAKTGLGYVDAVTKWITDPHSWERVAKVVLGGALLVAGVTIMARPAVTGAIGAVGSVLPTGKLAGAVGAVAKGAK